MRTAAPPPLCANQAALLPKNAPLSTLRVITASKAWLAQRQQKHHVSNESSNGVSIGSSTGSGNRSSNSCANGTSNVNAGAPGLGRKGGLPASAGKQKSEQRQHVDDKEALLQPHGPSFEAAVAPVLETAALVEVLTCVWRAGRAGKSTDHSGVLFDVDR